MSESSRETHLLHHERQLIASALREVSEFREPAPGRLPPDDSFTGYTITREIRRGAQGVVYQAVQRSTQQRVAIKVLHEGPFAGPRDKARFEREIHILGQLKHPNIVTIHDSGEASGHFYYVMDYIPGPTLDISSSSQIWSVEEVLTMFARVCDAVSAAHVRGIIHRDLKPGNIRVDAGGQPQVLDFGLAKLAPGAADPSSPTQVMTMAGQFLGSLPWASPEQASGDPERVDVRSDVYSLGVILYHMLTGRFPYAVVGKMPDVLNNILTAEPIRPGKLRRHLDSDVETIVLKCLHKSPERRYQGAGELARDIRHFLAGEPIEARRASSWYVLRKTARRQRLKIAALLIIATLTAWYGWTLREKQLALATDNLIEKGLRMESMGEWNTANTLFRRALDGNPESYRAMFYVARWLKMDYFNYRPYADRKRGDLLEAAVLCDRALEFEPDKHPIWNLKGEVLMSLDRLEEAEQSCRRALELQPDYIYSASILAKVLALQRRFPEALEAAEDLVDAALDLAEDDSGRFDDGFWRTLGMLQWHASDPRAMDSFRTAMGIDGKDYRNALLVARAHLTMADHLDYPEARELAERADINTGLDDPRFKRILAQALLMDGDPDKSIEYAQAALDGGDRPVVCHALLALAHAQLDDEDRASRHLALMDEHWPEELDDYEELVEAEKGLLWFDTREEIMSWRDQAERLLEEAGPQRP